MTDGDDKIWPRFLTGATVLLERCVDGDWQACTAMDQVCTAHASISPCSRYTLHLMLRCTQRPATSACDDAAGRPGVLTAPAGIITAAAQRAFAVGCVASCAGDTRDCACGCRLATAGVLQDEAQPFPVVDSGEPVAASDRAAYDAAVARGRKATRASRHAEAIAAFDEALDYGPEQAVALGGLAVPPRAGRAPRPRAPPPVALTRRSA